MLAEEVVQVVALPFQPLLVVVKLLLDLVSYQPLPLEVMPAPVER